MKYSLIFATGATAFAPELSRRLIYTENNDNISEIKMLDRARGGLFALR
jgi:hypothetical protein